MLLENRGVRLLFETRYDEKEPRSSEALSTKAKIIVSVTFRTHCESRTPSTSYPVLNSS